MKALSRIFSLSQASRIEIDAQELKNLCLSRVIFFLPSLILNNFSLLLKLHEFKFLIQQRDERNDDEKKLSAMALPREKQKYEKF